MIIRVTESEIKRMIMESVKKVVSIKENFGGFDEEYFGGFDEKSGSNDSNKMGGGSDVKRRGAIDLLYHPKDDAERDTYRSEFSKYLNPEDKDHVWDDSQINKLYNWLSDLL